VVVVCGKNDALRKELEELADRDRMRLAALPQPMDHASPDFQVLGFVANMEDWMVAADVLVSKAGPGTIAEACACGLPVLLYDFFPGQEEGNIEFVSKTGFGGFESNVYHVPVTVDSWLRDSDKMRGMRAAALAAARPWSAINTASEILGILDSDQQRSNMDAAEERLSATIATYAGRSAAALSPQAKQRLGRALEERAGIRAQMGRERRDAELIRLSVTDYRRAMETTSIDQGDSAAPILPREEGEREDGILPREAQDIQPQPTDSPSPQQESQPPAAQAEYTYETNFWSWLDPRRVVLFSEEAPTWWKERRK